MKGRRAIVAAYAAMVTAIAALPALAALSGEPLSLFTRDVFSVGEIPVYTGLYSNVGVLLWGMGAGVALYVAWLVGEEGRWGGERGALVGLGLLSAVLMVDDFLMLHEWIAPEFLGIPETVVVGTYAAATIGLVMAFRRTLLQHEPALLALAILFLGTSVGMDAIERPPAPAWYYMAEEGLKLLGIGSWAMYLSRLASRTARAAIDAPPPGRSPRRRA